MRPLSSRPTSCPRIADDAADADGGMADNSMSQRSGHRHLDRTVLSAGEVLKEAGKRVRELRLKRSLTLQDVSQRTGLSVSMLSLVERGKASPSIGSLVAITSCMGVHMTTLFDGSGRSVDPVVRREQQQSFETDEGVVRRVVKLDEFTGFEVVINEYEPGTGSGSEPVRHGGSEIGVVLDGSLTVELDGEAHRLRPGDAISYSSGIPHRIWNNSKRHVRTLWINLDQRWT